LYIGESRRHRRAHDSRIVEHQFFERAVHDRGQGQLARPPRWASCDPPVYARRASPGAGSLIFPDRLGQGSEAARRLISESRGLGDVLDPGASSSELKKPSAIRGSFTPLRLHVNSVEAELVEGDHSVTSTASRLDVLSALTTGSVTASVPVIEAGQLGGARLLRNLTSWSRSGAARQLPAGDIVPAYSRERRRASSRSRTRCDDGVGRPSPPRPSA
jgi:hypothetical protein